MRWSRHLFSLSCPSQLHDTNFIILSLNAVLLVCRQLGVGWRLMNSADMTFGVDAHATPPPILLSRILLKQFSFGLSTPVASYGRLLFGSVNNIANMQKFNSLKGMNLTESRADRLSQ